MNINKILNIIAALAFYAVAPLTHAQCPQNCDGEGNTSIGTNTTTYNEQFDTSVGNYAGAFLGLENPVSDNTAIGAFSLYGSQGSRNTGIGSNTLGGGANNLKTGSDNTATGYQALTTNDIGSGNTADGENALLNNTSGVNNTASGLSAL